MYMHESCRTHAGVMAHTWMSYSTHVYSIRLGRDVSLTVHSQWHNSSICGSHITVYIGWLRLVISRLLQIIGLFCKRALQKRRYSAKDRHKLTIGWLRLVSSFKLQVSFAEYTLFYRALLQKRPVIWRSLLIVATPYIKSRVIHIWMSWWLFIWAGYY